MAFGWPTRYLQLNVNEVDGGPEAYDRAVKEASDEYKCHTVSRRLSQDNITNNTESNTRASYLCVCLLVFFLQTSFLKGFMLIYTIDKILSIRT